MTRFALPWSISALMALGLTACSKSPHSDPPADPNNTMPVSDLTQAKQVADQAIAHCSDPSQCSSSVGLLIGASPTEIWLCTSFMVGPDLVATNSHCIPTDLKAAGSSCDQRMWVVFPDMPGAPSGHFDCQTVLSASAIDGTFTNPDFAFIRLSTQPNRGQFKLRHEGLADGSVLTAYSIDPYQGRGLAEGYLHSHTCKAVYNTILNSGQAPLSPVVALGDCKVVEGNSGSPLINADGNVTGVIFATEVKQNQASDLESLGLDVEGGQLADMGLATNYACQLFPTSLESGSLPAECSARPTVTQPPGDSLANDHLTDIPGVKSKIARDFGVELSHSGLNPSIEWSPALIPGDIRVGDSQADNETEWSSGDSIRLTTHYSVVPVPVCIHDVVAMLAFMESQSSKPLQVPAWEIQIKMTPYLQLDEVRSDSYIAQLNENLSYRLGGLLNVSVQNDYQKQLGLKTQVLSDKKFELCSDR